MASDIQSKPDETSPAGVRTQAGQGFTPGPWFATCVADPETGAFRWFDVDVAPTGKYRGQIAYVHSAEHINGVTNSECEANARLIAASPTMFSYIAKRAAAGDEEARTIVEAVNASR